MKKGNKRLLLYFIILIVVLLGLDIIIDYLENEILKLIIWIIIFGFLIFLFILLIKLSKRIDREDNEIANKFQEHMKNNEYEQARTLINNRMSELNYDISEVRCKFMLLILELTIGNNEQARNILEQTKWGIFKYHVYYYKIIFSLYDKDLEQAKVLYEKLKKINKIRKISHQEQIDNLNKLFNYFENGIKEELNTQLPIVKELLG